VRAAGRGARLAGIGVAACAACCAGWILGFLAAVGIGTVVGVSAFGLAGGLVATVAIVPIVPIVRRRRARAQCRVNDEPMPVAI
jgi:hypothetical protein